MLKPARRETVTKTPTSWQQFPHGKWLRDQLCEALAPHTAKIFGYYAVRLGHLAAQLELSDFRLRHDFSVAPKGEVHVHAILEYLPFAEATIDAVILAGQLEFERDPHQILREISRSLIADGYLVIAGFNPLCPALLSGLWPTNFGRFPWCGRYFTKARVSDWLSLLNFEIVASGYVGASFMWAATKRPDVGLAKVSQFVPQLRSMYYVVARKREFPLTVVRARKRANPRINSLPVANRVKKV